MEQPSQSSGDTSTVVADKPPGQYVEEVEVEAERGNEDPDYECEDEDNDDDEEEDILDKEKVRTLFEKRICWEKKFVEPVPRVSDKVTSLIWKNKHFMMAGINGEGLDALKKDSESKFYLFE